MDRFDQLSRDELLYLVKEERRINEALIEHLHRIGAANELIMQKTLLVGERYILLKNKLFGKSSERTPQVKDGDNSPSKEKKKRVLLPSERYPDAPLIEQDVEFKDVPTCSCCGETLTDSGMTENSEFLTIIPKQYFVVRQQRHKYECRKCHGDIQTAPLPPRIKEGSAYSDEMTIDVALTKYCDLIPIERYAAMAARGGIKNLPPQSLIETSHYLADYVNGAYEKLRGELLAAGVLHADETPHRMLEGDKKNSWFLWGFSSPTTSYFECHSTRSGDVASRLLMNAACRYLVSDVYTGYGKAVKDVNQVRLKEGLPLIEHVYCNAHARRYFRQAGERFPAEAAFFVEQYREVYRLEGLSKGQEPSEVTALREQMRPLFELMKRQAMEVLPGVSDKSLMAKAARYFVGNYAGLTRFLDNPELPIDNNPQERLLRSPVIGRKTWYGTHSKQGARTGAILFSLVESCKLNQINPREYFRDLVVALHQGLPVFTPAEYKNPKL
jgi:transposase